MASMPSKVLLIDSEMLIHLAVSQAYRDSGPYFITSSTAGEALSKMDIFSFDLFLLSLDLKDRDSLQLLQIIDQRFPQAPVIFLASNETDYSELFQRIEATKRQGSWQLIEKPFNLDILTILIERCLSEQSQKKPHPFTFSQRIAEKRNHFRNPKVKSVEFLIDAIDRGVKTRKRVKATLTDLSDGGLGLITKIPLEQSQAVCFENSFIGKSGVVAWTVPMNDHICRAGIQFC